MNTLRNRIAALLILAIVTVVGLATFAASRVLQPPLPQATIEPTARQIKIFIRVAERDRIDAAALGVRLQTEPAPGTERARLSRLLTRALEKSGVFKSAIVTENPEGHALNASINLQGDTWLIAEMPDFSPPSSRWLVLGVWIVLIVIGSTGVSVFAARKITRPLQLLEAAAGRIGTDGVLPHIPETGSGEVRATAQALNRLSARLKIAMESRMRLVAAAGHDLRTPMTRMRLRAEFIADKEERHKWFSDLEELDQIADSAIRLVREEADQHGGQIVELEHLVGDITDELTELGYSVASPLPRQISPAQALPLPVSAGPVALKRALRNLIINAATHGKSAKIELGQDGDEAFIKIIDDGPGIPDELIGKAFEPFFRVDLSRRKSVPGAGLGLAIAREIIERFGGTIAVANRKPRGLVQTIRLPLAPMAMEGG